MERVLILGDEELGSVCGGMWKYPWLSVEVEPSLEPIDDDGISVPGGIKVVTNWEPR
jgi:hypothetical protein